MKEVDFVLWLKKQEQMEADIFKARKYLFEMEKKLRQDESEMLQEAYNSGLFKIRLGDFVEELKAQRKGIKNITLIDDVTCFSGKQKITYKDEIGMGSRIFLGVNIFADGHHLMRLDGFQLSPYDTLANGMYVIDALKDNGSGNMLMFNNEELLKEVVVEFDPNSRELKTNPEIREAVFSIIEQRAANAESTKSKG